MVAQTQFRELIEGEAPKVLVSFNSLSVVVSLTQKPIGKYKKVGQESKRRLIELINGGWTIVKASTALGINYSTAKSIIQNVKSTSTSKPGSEATLSVNGADNDASQYEPL